MAVFRCKMCGGDLLITEGASTCTCEYCGTEQTVPAVKDENLQGLFNRANVLRMKAEFDKAEVIYEKILQCDESEAEAYWGLILCKYGIEYVEDPVTFKRIPTCHRTSYEAVTADEDYKNALKYADATQRGIYEAEAKAIDDIQKGILAISRKEESYDVFICYKETDENGKRTQDSVIANDIYYQLTQEGFKVFYAAITLEDKLGSEYEPYIFSALNTAKVMLCLGTKPEYFSAVWVRNEWSRFLRLMKKDRSKLLIPCYRDMDAYELPEEFAHLQAQDMSKIGFINDLIRGIRKVISRETEIPTSKGVIVESGNGTNTAPLLRRAFMFLEDGDWKRADEFCEQVLNLEPENAQAYVGKLMARLKVNKQENLADCEEPFDDKNNYLRAIRFASPELKEELEEYVESIKDRNETKRLNDLYAKALKKYETAKREEEYKGAASIFQSITGWKDSGEKAEEALEKAEEARKQSLYDMAIHQAELNQIETYRKAIELLEGLRGWKDSDEKILEYESAIQSIQSAIRELTKKQVAKRRERAKKEEEERLEREKRVEANKKKMRKLGIVAILLALIVMAVFVVMKRVIIPNNQYGEAEEMLSAEDYDGAIAAFTELGDYKDSADRVKEARYAKAEGLLSAENYDGAIAAFAELRDYKDSTDRVKEARYAKAEELLSAENYDGVIATFTELGDYKDAADRVKEARYAKAEKMLSAEDHDGAIAAFTELGDYEDAADRVKEAEYAKAEEMLSVEDYDGAIATFTELGDYEDAADRVKEARYAKAEEMLSAEDYDGAIAAFSLLGDYKDSADILNHIYLLPAKLERGAAYNCFVLGYNENLEISVVTPMYSDINHSKYSDFVYDDLGRIVSYKMNDHIYSYEYNEQGDAFLTIISESTNQEYHTQYDQYGNPTSADTYSYENEVDEYDNLTSVRATGEKENDGYRYSRSYENTYLTGYDGYLSNITILDSGTNNNKYITYRYIYAPDKEVNVLLVLQNIKRMGLF